MNEGKTKTLAERRELAQARTSFEIQNNPPDKDANGDVIGFAPYFTTQFGLPHSSVKGNIWQRKNGNETLSVYTDCAFGLPSGSKPRLLLAWVATWQVRHPNATVIELGKNVSARALDTRVICIPKWETIVTELLEWPRGHKACGLRLIRKRVNTMVIASWNVNSIKARLEHVTAWLQSRNPDVLLLQELKGLDFPFEVFKGLGYESVAVTQKAYNGVAILSRSPIESLEKVLSGDEADTHARYLEVMISGIRVVDIYLPNGNPVGTDKFEYKLAWMERLLARMSEWKRDGIHTVVGGDFNVIPEDIDCHKPASWIRDALFQPEPRALYRAMLNLGYTDAFRSLHPEAGQFTFWDYFRQAFENNRGIRIDHFLVSPSLRSSIEACEIDREPRAQPKPSDHTPILLTLR